MAWLYYEDGKNEQCEKCNAYIFIFELSESDESSVRK